MAATPTKVAVLRGNLADVGGTKFREWLSNYIFYEDIKTPLEITRRSRYQSKGTCGHFVQEFH